MLKIISKLILLVLLISCNEDQLSSLHDQVSKELAQAKECMKQLVPGQLSLCSIDTPEININDKEACLKQFKQANVEVEVLSQSDSDRYPKFVKSTNRAMLLHNENKVLFRKDVYNKIDCYHEYIHYLQSQSQNKLSLLKRRHLSEKFKKILSLNAQRVSEYELENNKKAINELAVKVQNGINLLTDFNSLSNSLDEIEAYHQVLNFCDKSQSCSREDIEIAIANLYERRKHLSEQYQDSLQNRVNTILQSKKKEALKRVQSNWKSSKLKSIVKSMVKLSIDEIIKLINNEGISVYRIASTSDFNFAKIKKDLIPLEKYKKIPIIKDQFRELIGLKLILGKAMGKYICSAQKQFIILNRLFSKSVLIHEYLHAKQYQQNKSYCAGDSKQKKLLFEFKNGIISKPIYESQVLDIQMRNLIAEEEVYKALSTFDSYFTDLDNLNNKAKLMEIQRDLQYLK